MRKLLRDRSGATAIEFGLVAIPFFFAMFGIFDLGRYGITVHSLGTLASATTRAVLITCYSPNVVQGQSPSACKDPLTDAEKCSIAPFLCLGGSRPRVIVSPSGSALVVQATQDSFKPLMPFWGKALDSPSRSAALPY